MDKKIIELSITEIQAVVGGVALAQTAVSAQSGSVHQSGGLNTRLPMQPRPPVVTRRP